MKITDRKKILVTAPSGFIIRNLLMGKFLPSILEESDLVIAVLDPSEENLVKTFKDNRLKFITYPRFKEIQKKFIHQLLDPHFWMYLLSVGAKNNRSIKNYVLIYDTRKSIIYKGFREAIFLVGYIFQAMRLMHVISRAYLNFYRNHPLTQTWKQIIIDHKPDLLFSTMLTLTHKNVPSSDLPAVLAAKEMGIKSATLIQSWDNLSSKPNIVPEILDAYMVWSSNQYNELLRYFYSIDRIKVSIVGAVQFDFHTNANLIESRDTYLKKIGFLPSDKYVLIGTGMPKSVPYEIEEMVMLIKAIHKTFPSIKILLRIHPKDISNRITRYIEELQRFNTVVDIPFIPVHMDAGGFTPPETFYKDQINSIFHSELVINTASTISVDAAIIDRPIICIGFNYIKEEGFPDGRSWSLANSSHYLPLVKTKGIKIARSEQQVCEFIDYYLNNKTRDKEYRTEIVQLVTNAADGKAGERIVEVIRELFLSRKKL